MKIASLLYALCLTLLDLCLIYSYEFYSPTMLVAIVGVFSTIALGLLLPINSFLAKILVAGSFSLYAIFLNQFSLNAIIIFSALVFHSSSLWFEAEKFGGASTKSEHFKVTHRLRHQWFGSLGFFAGLSICYLLIKDFYNFPEFYGVSMILVSALCSLMYMEINRTHNQSILWIDISGSLTKSVFYWRLVSFAAVILFGVFWFLSTPVTDFLLEVRSSLDRDHKSKEGEDDSSMIKAPGTRSGFSPGDVVLTSKVDLQLSDKPEFYIKIEDDKQARRLRNRPLYISAQELIYYSNNIWKPENVEVIWYKDEDDGVKDGKIDMSRMHRYSVPHSIYLLRKGATSVFSLSGLHRIDLPEVFQSSMGVMGMRQINSDLNKKYTVHSNFYNFNFIKKGSLSVGTTEVKYLQLPMSEMAAKIKDLTSRIVLPRDSNVQKIIKIKDFLARNCQYSLQVKNPKNRAPLDNFIFYEKKGHCVLFASAYTLMLRSAGIPARMVNGFAGGDYDLKKGVYVMKSSNAHAWTEIYCKNYGWVVCDPTPEAFNISPGMTSADDFDESAFEDMSTIETANKVVGSSANSFFTNGKNILLTLAMLVALLSFTWQYLRKIPGISFMGGNRKKVILNRPPYVQVFEEFCRARGIASSRSRTVRELLADLMKTGTVDEEILKMVSYYYNVTFAGVERNEASEKMWHSYILKLIKQA